VRSTLAPRLWRQTSAAIMSGHHPRLRAHPLQRRGQGFGRGMRGCAVYGSRVQGKLPRACGRCPLSVKGAEKERGTGDAPRLRARSHPPPAGGTLVTKEGRVWTGDAGDGGCAAPAGAVTPAACGRHALSTKEGHLVWTGERPLRAGVNTRRARRGTLFSFSNVRSTLAPRLWRQTSAAIMSGHHPRLRAHPLQRREALFRESKQSQAIPHSRRPLYTYFARFLSIIVARPCSKTRRHTHSGAPFLLCLGLSAWAEHSLSESRLVFVSGPFGVVL
jgi:hypothetical protein